MKTQLEEVQHKISSKSNTICPNIRTVVNCYCIGIRSYRRVYVCVCCYTEFNEASLFSIVLFIVHLRPVSKHH